jgi:hypothetical protein
MTDQDLMPFGKYKRREDGESSSFIFALVVFDVGLYAGVRTTLGAQNETVLVSECPDYINDRR